MGMRSRKVDNYVLVRPHLADKIRALCAEYPDGGDWREYANDMMETFMEKHRTETRMASRDAVRRP